MKWVVRFGYEVKTGVAYSASTSRKQHLIKGLEKSVLDMAFDVCIIQIYSKYFIPIKGKLSTSLFSYSAIDRFIFQP